MGRNCISFEVNPDYVEIIEKKAKINQIIKFQLEEKPEAERKVQSGMEDFFSK